jgi:hypothetical protein
LPVYPRPAVSERAGSTLSKSNSVGRASGPNAQEVEDRPDGEKINEVGKDDKEIQTPGSKAEDDKTSENEDVRGSFLFACYWSHTYPVADQEVQASKKTMKSSDEIEADAWNEAFFYLKKKDDEMVKEYEDDINTLLTFARIPCDIVLLHLTCWQAGLFSAVLTAFIIEAYQRLEEDPAETSAILLRRISMQLEGSPVEPIAALTQQKTSAAILTVNIFWFLSLLLSLFAALFGILAKQWIHGYNKWSEDSPVGNTLLLRRFCRVGFDDWYAPEIVTALPVLLQVALFSFLIGLSVYLWSLNTVIAAILSILSALMVLVAVITIILPGFYDSCPYRTPLGRLAVYLRFDLGRKSPDVNISSWKSWDACRVNQRQTHTHKASKNGEWIVEYLGALLDIRRPLVSNEVIDFEHIQQMMNSVQPASLKKTICTFISDCMTSNLFASDSRSNIVGGIYAKQWASLLGNLNRIISGGLMDIIEGRWKS